MILFDLEEDALANITYLMRNLAEIWDGSLTHEVMDGLEHKERPTAASQ